MDFMVVFGVMLLFQEASTVFVSLRWPLYKHKMNDTTAYNINALAAFLSFLVLRVAYQIYITFFVAMDWVYAEIEKKSIGTLQAVAIGEMMLMVLLSLALNLYWMNLMCKMAKRSAARMSNPET